MKAAIAIMIIFCATATITAQVAPEGISPRKLGISGTLTYSAYYAQMYEDYGGASGQIAMLSGNFGYATTSERHPTSITFAAGDSWTISGIGYDMGLYENLSLNQGIAGERWSLQLSDNVGYFPGSPLAGFSGVPGSGQPISGSGAPPSVNDSILTFNTAMLDESANAAYTYKLSALTSLSAGGGAFWLMFPDGGGFATDSYMANVGLTHRLDARNAISGTYAYSEFTYPGTSFAVYINTAMAGWQRTWTRTISSSISAGPQWVSSSGSATGAAAAIGAIPSSTGTSVNASLTDNTHFGNASLSYDRGVMAGGGYLYGGEEDTVTGSFNREFGHRVGSQWNLEFAGGYFHYSSLGSQAASTEAFNGSGSGIYGSAQVTRSLGRYVSVFSNYTATDQSYGSQASGIPSNAPTSLWQVFSVGIGYTPRPIHLRH